MTRKIYLDYNATTPLRDEVLEAMQPFMKGIYGNASSMHFFGREAKKALEASRETLASYLGALRPDEIIFTGCGTESDNLALKGAAWANIKKGRKIITSNIEHHAVLYTCQYLEKNGFTLSFAGSDTSGVIPVDNISGQIDSGTTVVSVMHANNEIGTIQPVEEIGAVCRSKGVYFHTDAVQTAGKLPIDVEKMNIDLLSISAHKFYGPKGVGALYCRRGVRLTPLLHGGHHEKNKRAGTENVAGIVGMAKALELAVKESGAENARLKGLKDKLSAGILSRVPNCTLNGDPEKQLANTLSVTFEFVEGEGIVLTLDKEGVALSTGSACASGDLEPSHVLKALGVPKDKAHGTVRFSLGKYVTDEDIDYLIDRVEKGIRKLRDMSPLWEDYIKIKNKK